MIRRKHLLSLFVALFLVGQVTPCVSASDENSVEDEPRRQYVRIERNERNLADKLQTSVIRFGNSAQFPGKVVDLLGASHLGEASYYQELERRFRDYDALLFEAVMPAAALKSGLRPGGDGSLRGIADDEGAWDESKIGLATISALQLGMKDVLGLQFQLSGIDYYAKNFVHADMTQEEMEAAMARRGESFSEMLSREMGKAMVRSTEVDPIARQVDVVFSLMATDRKYRIRRIGAAEMVEATELDVFAGPDGTSTIITERNIKALQVLRRELGKPENKLLGIFYGAGHFGDMEERMVSEFGFERVSEEWITAWQLRAPKKPKELPASR